MFFLLAQLSPHLTVCLIVSEIVMWPSVSYKNKLVTWSSFLIGFLKIVSFCFIFFFLCVCFRLMYFNLSAMSFRYNFLNNKRFVTICYNFPSFINYLWMSELVIVNHNTAHIRFCCYIIQGIPPTFVWDFSRRTIISHLTMVLQYCNWFFTHMTTL